ncbi:MAG: BamA/TamA family outer membrane protein [Acidobacteria bacterium]|nr:BamA/TamA family outer membrane protein [Acidobacteriota bacterium]
MAEIRFDPQIQPLPAEELKRLIGIEINEPLTAVAVRRAIQRLYGTGRYEELQVDAILRDGNVILTFFTKQNWFLSRITVEGAAEPPNREQLIAATKLELGAQYTEEGMAEAMAGLREILQANGFYSPRIQPLVERYPAFDELHVQFLIRPGDRAYFARPVITGNMKIPEHSILNTSHWKRLWGVLGWQQFSEQRMLQGIERIRRSFLRKDFLLARVELNKLEYIPEENRVRPHLHMESGPKVSVVATGTKLSRGRLKELIPVFQEQSVDQDLLEEGSRKITHYFQARGYFDAEVSYDRSQISPEEERIEFDIDRGDRYKVAHVEIKGNRYFDALTLRERMNVVPAGWLVNRYGRYSEELLESDKRAIAELYRSNGFRDVKVNAAVQRNFQGKHRQVSVEVDVEEGEQMFVSSLEISGVDLRLYETVRSMLTSTDGQPYSPFGVATDRDNILNFYYNNGYPDASMDVQATAAPGNERMMDLKYVVQEGRRLFVKDVQVNGLSSTRTSLVDNRISLFPGLPLSLSRMVFSQRRLYDLGIFAKVDMALQNPLGSVREKRVLFQMEEASRYSLNGGIGAEFGRIGGSSTSLSAPAGGASFAPRVSLGLSRLNFMGLGHTVGLQTRLSTLQKRGVITYLAPQFQGRENISLTFTGLYDDSRNVRTFSSRRFEGAAQFGQRFTRAFQTQYRITVRRVSNRDVLIDPKLILPASQPARIGLVSTTLIHDKRDDPLNATRGLYNSVDVSLATKALASETGFGRILARNSSYHRITRDLVLSRNTTLGWIKRYGGNEIPISELFYAGGAVSHRGFPENQAGPRDLLTGFPNGGNGLLFNQTELRIPFIGENLGGVIFHDAGNVYSRFRNISFRPRQKNDEDFDYMVHAVGIGVRYKTPIGPIRVDFGFGLNSPRFVGYRGSLQELFEQAALPGGIPEDRRVRQRVSAFQFHFSLGQAF